MFGHPILAQLFCFNYFITAQVIELKLEFVTVTQQVKPAFFEDQQASD